jgi:hypothetical protein
MSSFFDSASLVQIPSGYSDGTLYSVKPIDGTGDLTFSRGSDIEATRVASNGYIEKAAVNILLQSNSFDTTWTASNASVTGGQSGYDGSNDAWLLDKNASQGRVIQSISQSGIQTLSVYAKKGTSEFLRMFVNGPNSSIIFNLNDGSVQNSSSIVSGKSTDVGGGWYRCEVAFDGNTAAVNIYPAESGGTAGTSGNVYIQDAQLNYGLVAQEYQETTTTSVVSGITNDMPRLDYSGGASCPSLLLEPSRQNLVTQSEYLDGLAKLSATIASNDITSPEGVDNGSKLKPNSGQTFSIDGGGGYTIGSASYVRSSDLTLTAASYTFSAFVKKGEYDQIQLRSGTNIDTTSGGSGTRVDLNDGTIISSNGTASSIEDYGSGWYRISHTFTATAASWYLNLWFWNTTSVTANGTDGVYAYGFQCEAGSYSTSLIPTYGTSATRTADACSKTGISSLIGQTEGTLFFETEVDDPSTGNQLFSLDNGTVDDRIEIFASGSGASIGNIGVYVERGSAQVINTTNVNVQGRHKIALAYKQNDYALYIDGVLKHTDTSALVPACSVVRLVGRYDNFNEGKHKTKQALLFKTRLTNAQLAELTTL